MVLDTQDLSASVLTRLQPVLPYTASVHLQGWGEVMMLDDLPDQIRWFKEQGCRVSITTNGSLMSPARAESLVTCGLDALTFSMAGASEKVHDRYRGQGSHLKLWQAMQNLFSARKKMSSRTPALAVSYLLTPDTFPELPRAIHKSRSCGITLFAGVHMTHPVTENQQSMCLWQVAHKKYWQKIIRRAHWQAFLGRIKLQLPPLQPVLTAVCDKNPLTCCFIAADGTVAPCVFLAPPKTHPGSDPLNSTTQPLPVQLFGSLNTESLPSISGKNEYRQFRQAFLQRKIVYDREMAKVGVDLNGIDQLEQAKSNIQRAFEDLPVPVCCTGCSKMEGY